MTNKERRSFEKELKEALDNLAAVIYKYYPDNTYLDACVMGDYMCASNDYWEKGEKGFYLSWRGDKVYDEFIEIRAYKKEGGNSDSV